MKEVFKKRKRDGKNIEKEENKEKRKKKLGEKEEEKEKKEQEKKNKKRKREENKEKKKEEKQKKRKILKEEIIGLGSIDGKHKTILGRYTNHSDDNNAMFYYLKNRDVVMVVERDIDKDEEILINYNIFLIDSFKWCKIQFSLNRIIDWMIY